MAYTGYDFKTKKALKQALLDGEFISVYQPGPFGPDVKDGTVSLEGPHYPKPHTWYAQGEVVNGKLIKIK
jgi:hypothetical protein